MSLFPTGGDTMLDRFLEAISDYYLFTQHEDSPTDEEVSEAVDFATGLVEHLMSEGWLAPRMGEPA